MDGMLRKLSIRTYALPYQRLPFLPYHGIPRDYPFLALDPSDIIWVLATLDQRTTTSLYHSWNILILCGLSEAFYVAVTTILLFALLRTRIWIRITTRLDRKS